MTDVGVENGSGSVCQRCCSASQSMKKKLLIYKMDVVYTNNLNC